MDKTTDTALPWGEGSLINTANIFHFGSEFGYIHLPENITFESFSS